ncbi:MAG TPA: glycosyltransferase family 39 protein, partial [Chloroflexota bacterium]|nr:glycosyltransferase family 39 protein [Chloroflexota bacterium]
GGSSVIGDPQAAHAASDPLAIAVDIHPPLYYLLLHEWMQRAGRGEYAVRFASVMVGLLLVLALYKLGASVASRTAGLLAAAAGAVTPFYVAYSQEARMYAPVALFSAFSLYFTWRVIERRESGVGSSGVGSQESGVRRRVSLRRLLPWVGLIVSSSLALYTHYSAVLVIGAENALVAAMLLWRWLSHRGTVSTSSLATANDLRPDSRLPTPDSRLPPPASRLLLAWAAAQLVQLVLFFPWLRTSIGQVAAYNQNLWVPNWQHELTDTFAAFDAGLWIPPAESLWLAVPVTALLLAGLVALLVRRRRGWSASGKALAFAGGTLALETVLALVAFQIRPEFHPRYLMVLATPYYLLLGLTLTALWRRWWPAGMLAGAALAAVFVVGLWGYEFDPNYAKDDTRTLAQYLASHTTAQDVIVLDAPEPLDYYYHGPAQLVYVAGEDGTAAQKLSDATTGKQRAVYVQWFLSTSDPEQLLPFLFQKYGRLVDDRTFRGYRERIYALPSNAQLQLTDTSQPQSADFDGTFQLEGLGLGPAANGDPQLLSELSRPVTVSGGNLMLALKWRLLKPVTKDYKASAYLTDQAGHLGGQVDLLLRHGQAATPRWRVGEEAVNYYVLETLPGLMPGLYTLNLAVYADGEQERLSVLDAAGAPGSGNVAVGTVEVLPPAGPTQASSLSIPKALDDSVAPGVRLIGYEPPSQPIGQGD